MFEALIAPIVFTVIIAAVLVWALVARARRRVSKTDPSSASRASNDRPRRSG